MQKKLKKYKIYFDGYAECIAESEEEAEREFSNARLFGRAMNIEEIEEVEPTKEEIREYKENN